MNDFITIPALSDLSIQVEFEDEWKPKTVGGKVGEFTPTVNISNPSTKLITSRHSVAFDFYDRPVASFTDGRFIGIKYPRRKIHITRLYISGVEFRRYHFEKESDMIEFVQSILETEVNLWEQ